MSKKVIDDMGALLHMPRSKTKMPKNLEEGMEIKRVLVPLDQIDFYEHNPRQRPNEVYEEIRESIRNDGLHNELDITQRPDSDRFILDRGGNTRLKALKELLREGEERFREVWVKVHPFVSETVIQTRHLVENNTRSDMSFWDNAQAHMKLWADIEEETGKKISARNVTDAFAERGLIVQKSSLYLFKFAGERLDALGDAAQLLSATLVKGMQALINQQIVAVLDLHKNQDLGDSSEILRKWLKDYRDNLMDKEEPDKEFRLDRFTTYLFDRLQDLTSIKRSEVDKFLSIAKRYPKDSYDQWIKLLRPEARQQATEIANPVVDHDVSSDSEPQAPSYIDLKISTRRDAYSYDAPIVDNQGKHHAEPQPLITPELNYIPAEAVQQQRNYHSMLDVPDITLGEAYTRVHRAVLKFGRIAGYQKSLMLPFIKTMNEGFGFWVEPLLLEPNVNYDVTEDTPHKDSLSSIYGGYWAFLAQLSGQFGFGISELLPEDSSWRRINQVRNGVQDADVLSQDEKLHLDVLNDHKIYVDRFIPTVLYGDVYMSNQISGTYTTDPKFYRYQSILPISVDLIRCIGDLISIKPSIVAGFQNDLTRAD